MARTKNRSCNDKVAMTEEQARIIAAQICAERQTAQFHYYKCDFGNHYHVGHKPYRIHSKRGKSR